MHAFTRLTSFLLFVLSLSFLTCALPAPAAAGSKALTTRSDGAAAVLSIVADLKVKFEAHANAMVGCDNIASVNVEVGALVDTVGVAIKAIVEVGANIEVDAHVKAQIAAEIVACLTLIVQACLTLSAKFGLTLLLAIFLKIDVCLHLLLVKLGVCINGIVHIIAKMAVGTCAGVFAKLQFTLCANILAVVQVGL